MSVSDFSRRIRNRTHLAFSWLDRWAKTWLSCGTSAGTNANLVPAYTMAPHAETLRLLRVVVREDFSLQRAQIFLRGKNFPWQDNKTKCD